MIKLFSIVLIAAASLMTGFTAASNLRRRKSILTAFCRMIEDISAEIRYQSTPIPRIFEGMRPDSYKPLEGFVGEICRNTGGSGFHTAWDAALQQLRPGMDPEAVHLLSEFGQSLGRTDKTGQAAACEKALLGCRRLEQLAAERCTKLSGLYLNLGAMGGVAAAILFL